MAERVRGYLTVTVAEASGTNKDSEVVWDNQLVDGFVKVEVRGGSRNIKVQSSQRRVDNNTLKWDETLKLEVLEASKELRIVLCRDKRSGSQHRTSVVAACGIFIDDIIDAVPIDKYFEMFKPGAAGEGGFIRVAMAFDEHQDEIHEPIEEVDEEPLAPTVEIGKENRPGIGDSFKPQLSGALSNLTESQGTQKEEKENRPPPAEDAGSMTSPKASITFAHKHDEAQSRDRTPELGTPELGSGNVYHDARDDEEIDAQPDHQTVKRLYQSDHQETAIKPLKNKKKKGNKVAKFLTSVLLVGLAGGAAVFIKQEMDKSKNTDSEILIVDEEIDEDTLECQ